MIENINSNWGLCKSGPLVNSVFDNDWSMWSGNSTFTEVITNNCDAISIPHTWNNKDGQDGGNDYFRGTYWYTKTLPKIELAKDQEAYLEFAGVNSVAEAYVNGHKVTTHKGGFSTFRANITKFLGKENRVAVKVNNEISDAVYPQKADFTFFGGIYRDVNIIVVNKTHFDLEHYGDDGCLITPTVEKLVSTKAGTKQKGKIHVDCKVANYNGENIKFTLKDKKKKTVYTQVFPSTKFTTTELDVYLWEGVDNPYRYTANISIIDSKKKVLDSKNIKIGFRTFSVDPEHGFFLNGKSYPLRGVSKHQDREDKGWAVSIDDLEEDMELIDELGANVVRLAHYQHDQYFYDLLDDYGVIAWAEIPYISMSLPNGHDNVINQMKELIYQNYNHPSICFWGLSNEITVDGESEDIINTHKELNALAKSIDSTRLTTIAHVTALEGESPLNYITDIVGYNHYFGWYQKTYDDYGPWFDNFHAQYPNVTVGIAEYGCEANTHLHAIPSKKTDYTEEYQAIYHEKLLAQIEARPYLWATFVWNMFDFAADQRAEGGYEGRNNKGLVTYDRKTKKDSFYIYRAHWSHLPTLHITSKRYEKRTGDSMYIKVYSNKSKVSLYVNDKLFATKKGEYIFEFENVPLNGTTTVKAVSGSLVDTAVFQQVDKPCEEYVLKVVKEVKTWYDKDGNALDLKYDENHLSLLNTPNEIKSRPACEAIFRDTMGEIYASVGLNQSVDGLYSNAGDIALQDLFGYFPYMTPDNIKKVNEALQTCDA